MKSSRKLLFGRTLLLAFISTMAVIILTVYLTGLSDHRSLIENSLISLSILSVFLFLFLFVGLYNGLNVYDNYSHKLELSWRNAKKRIPDSMSTDITGGISMPDIDADGDGIGGIILAIFLWVAITIILIVLLVTLQAIIWTTIVLIVMALYWIIIRGLKLIFNKSNECQNDIGKSLIYAISYTCLYVGWIYGIIYVAAFIKI